MKCGIRLGNFQTYYRTTEQPYKFIIQPINTLLQGIIAKKTKDNNYYKLRRRKNKFHVKVLQTLLQVPIKKSVEDSSTDFYYSSHIPDLTHCAATTLASSKAVASSTSYSSVNNFAKSSGVNDSLS